MQSIDSIETYAYGMSKDLVSEKEVINCNNMMKRYESLLTLVMLQKKTKQNPNWPQFPILHNTEY